MVAWVQLVESWVRSTFVAFVVSGSIAALWPDYFETIVLAEVPFGIGAAIEVECWVAYCFASSFVA